MGCDPHALLEAMEQQRISIAKSGGWAGGWMKNEFFFSFSLRIGFGKRTEACGMHELHPLLVYACSYLVFCGPVPVRVSFAFVKMCGGRGDGGRVAKSILTS